MEIHRSWSDRAAARSSDDRVTSAMKRDGGGENGDPTCGVQSHDVIVGQRTEVVSSDDDGVILVFDRPTGDVDQFIDDCYVGDRSDVGETTRLDSE